MPFQIIRNDITKVKADAIVNTANPKVQIGSGVDFAIYEAAGMERLLEARREIGNLKPGEVGITKAFNLDAKFIIHASGPKWRGGDRDEANILRQCYDKSLELAYEHKCKSIAFPLLATGAYGFPKELGLQIAVDAFTTFLEQHEIEIILVVFESDVVKISGSLVDELASFIDDDDVGRAPFSEYGVFEEPDLTPRTGIFHGSIAGSTKSNKVVPFSERKSEQQIPNLEEALKEIYTESLGKYIQKIINKKGLKNSQVYSAANISKQYFSKLVKDQVKNPSKEKMLSMAIGLRLNLDEAIDFLSVAGYALSPISQTDLIVKYFILKGDYNVIKINYVLFDFGLDSISNE
ncbi:MAG: macro domain-containing protein [Pseudobutyrivibrio sp.]|uniref:macro domain-containing protein n=1 Tax=Pseudobutyrivibrio sp. TaxID=2014367 RepID=UPI0025F9B7A5|nr:macro domain-containing protein [Pseudobutyrivibrio sp.]MBQ6462801.1 macro domain-containing protein [Pseudobutyrivibrio sp.]